MGRRRSAFQGRSSLGEVGGGSECLFVVQMSSMCVFVGSSDSIRYSMEGRTNERNDDEIEVEKDDGSVCGRRGE